VSESDPGVEIAVSVEAGASPQEVREAAGTLLAGRGVLMPALGLALRVCGGVLRCELRDPEPRAHRCAVEYEVMVENCRRALEASDFAAHLPSLPKRWTVIDGSDPVPQTLWTAP